MEKNVFYLNKELQLAKSKSDMIAIACYHKDDDPDSLYQLGNTRLGKIVSDYREKEERVELDLPLVGGGNGAGV